MIKLTSEENSVAYRRQQYEEALKQFQTQVAQDIASKRKHKVRASNKDTIAKIDEKAAKSAEKIVESVRKGWRF